MSRDNSHSEQIERWADYIMTHPDEWKAKLKPFLDSQIIIARRAYAKLAENGEFEKIKLLKIKS